ncbi:methyltransferase, FxLD system [Kitasatospora sp. NPDC048298]|uniref:methyltransferase, FxLD system n=1 Tax=Kitasatospora sp. NPDC048298 TaxID=3364049 RepID=UPI00371AB85D
MSDTVEPEATSAETPEQLRTAMVERLISMGEIRTAAVERAFRTVPREAFVPEAPARQAYGVEDVVITKRNEHGTAISSVSAPRIQAFMLEQADIKPGHRVLEIGSSGTNAAMIAELVGPDGEITTLDIDRDVTDRATRGLAATGYDRVNVVLGDGEVGCADRAPFDRILVTVGAWDIPPAWVEQLTERGTVTVPLRMRGVSRSITLRREADRLVSVSAEVCGFVRMQGAGAHEEQLLLLRGEEVGLRFDEEPPADAGLLTGALDTDRTEEWTGVTVGRMEPFDSLHLRLATALPGFCMMSVDPKLDTGLVAPQNRISCPAMTDGSSLAYLALRKVSEDPMFEFGAHGYGPDGAKLAAQLAEQIHTWDHAHRSGPGPQFTVHPATTPDDRLGEGRVIDKRHTRITISWP